MRILGRGSFGTVAQAINLDTGDLMAVKMVTLQRTNVLKTVVNSVRYGATERGGATGAAGGACSGGAQAGLTGFPEVGAGACGSFAATRFKR